MNKQQLYGFLVLTMFLGINCYAMEPETSQDELLFLGTNCYPMEGDIPQDELVKVEGAVKPQFTDAMKFFLSSAAHQRIPTPDRSGEVAFCVFNLEGNRLAVGTTAGMIQIIDADTCQSIQVLKDEKACKRRIGVLAFNPHNKKYLASGSGPLGQDGVVCIWNLEKGTKHRTYKNMSLGRGAIKSIDYNPEASSQIAITTHNRYVKLLNSHPKRVIDVMHYNNVSAVHDLACRFVNDKNKTLLAVMLGSVRLQNHWADQIDFWDTSLENPQLLRVFNKKFMGDVLWSPDGTEMCRGFLWGDKLTLWNTQKDTTSEISVLRSNEKVLYNFGKQHILYLRYFRYNECEFEHARLVNSHSNRQLCTFLMKPHYFCDKDIHWSADGNKIAFEADCHSRPYGIDLYNLDFIENIPQYIDNLTLEEATLLSQFIEQGIVETPEDDSSSEEDFEKKPEPLTLVQQKIANLGFNPLFTMERSLLENA